MLLIANICRQVYHKKYLLFSWKSFFLQHWVKDNMNFISSFLIYLMTINEQGRRVTFILSRRSGNEAAHKVAAKAASQLWSWQGEQTPHVTQLPRRPELPKSQNHHSFSQQGSSWANWHLRATDLKPRSLSTKRGKPRQTNIHWLRTWISVLMGEKRNKTPPQQPKYGQAPLPVKNEVC